MGVGNIPGAEQGANLGWAWKWSLRSVNARFGSLMALFTGGGALPYEVVCVGEAGAGRVVGPCMQSSVEPALTTLLPADPPGVQSVTLAQAPGHGTYILAPNFAVTQGNDLIPEVAPPALTYGRVQPRPAGNTTPAVAVSRQTLGSSANEQYVAGEVLSFSSAPGGGQVIVAQARDAVLTGKYLGGPGSLLITPAANAQAPIIHRAVADGEILTNFRLQLETAAGGGKAVAVILKKGATVAAAIAAAASLTLTITDPAVSVDDDTTVITLSKGDVVIAVTSTADAGAAVNLMLQCRKG